MPAKKKSAPVKAKATVRHFQKPSRLERAKSAALKPYQAVKKRITGLLERRPHRSFRRTRQRDYARSLKLPGYWAFTNEVRRILWQHKYTFLLLVVLYGTLSAVLVGLASQSTYAEISNALQESGGDLFQGNWGEIGKAGLLLTTGVVGSLNDTPTDAQRISGGILALMVWLTTVWLLRAMVAGRKPKLRDGLYNAGAPIVSSFLVSLVLILQLLPLAIVAIGYGAAVASGLLNGGVEAMVFWIVALLLAALSLYWFTSTFIALVVITLPGMYPMQALRTAGDLVVGRRVRILLRQLWLVATMLVVWVVAMIPLILFDTWLKKTVPAIEWLPIVPVSLLVMASLSVVWSAAYTYLLYRKVVDDDASPA